MVLNTVESSKLPIHKDIETSATQLTREVYQNFFNALWSDWLIAEQQWNDQKWYINQKKFDRIIPVSMSEVLKFLNITSQFNEDELKQLCTLVSYQLLVDASWTIEYYNSPQLNETFDKMLEKAETRTPNPLVQKAIDKIRLEQKICLDIN